MSQMETKLWLGTTLLWKDPMAFHFGQKSQVLLAYQMWYNTHQVCKKRKENFMLYQTYQQIIVKPEKSHIKK